MRKIVALLVCLFCSSLTWGQYIHTYSTAQKDLSSYAPTNNLWNTIVASCLPSTLSVGNTGPYCISSNDSYVWKYDQITKAGIKQTAMGTASKIIAVSDVGNIWALQSTPYCTTQHNLGWGIFKWDGAVWTQPNSLACLSTLTVSGTDSTLSGTNISLIPYKSTNGGSTWTQIDTTPSWTQFVSADATHFCGVKGGVLYTGSTTLTAFSPSPGTIAGCAYGKGALDANYTLVTWTSGGATKFYDWTAGAWKAMTGISSSFVAVHGKGMVFAETSTGSYAHANLLPYSVTAKTTGTFTLCPNTPCPGGATHTDSIGINFPHGLSGQLATETAAPTTNMNISSTDFSPTCDPFTGDPSDPECNPVISGTDHCNTSNQTLDNPPPFGDTCVMDGLSDAGVWDVSSTVTVYFSSLFFPHTTCHAGDIGDACNVYAGISAWDGKTVRLVHYSYGGVVDVGACQIYTMDGPVYVPCNATYPFEIVTGLQGSFSLSGVIFKPAGGNGKKFGYIFIATNTLDGTAAEQKSDGAHEEGHHHGLGNCNSLTCPGMFPSQTVMWDLYDPSQPIAPTLCDTDWASFFELEYF
jgi:hypothetical protein